MEYIVNVDDPEQRGLLFSFDQTGPAAERENIRGNKMMAIGVRDVVPSVTNSRPWDDDHLPSDTIEVAIGNIDDAPQSGTTALTFGVNLTSGVLVTSKWYYIVDFNAGDNFTNVGGVNATGSFFQASTTTPTTWSNGSTLRQTTAAIAFNISAANLKAALEAAYPAAYGTVTVTGLTEPGSYRALWDTAGAVPALSSPFNSFAPTATVSVVVREAGDSTTRADQYIYFRQSPVAFATPATEYPAAGVTANITQAGSGSANKTYAISLDAPGTYAGTYNVAVTTKSPTATATGVATWNMSENDFLAMLVATTGKASTDFSVTRSNDVLIVEFKGTQGLDNAVGLVVTNIDLVAPKGVSGFLNLNTFEMYDAFNASIADELTFTFAIRRTRVSGEETEILQLPIVVKRNLIDVSTLVPASLPTYVTVISLATLAPILRLDIDGYTTEGALNLDEVDAGIPGMPIGGVIFITGQPGSPRVYQIVNSSAATSSPGFIRAANWAATNAAFEDFFL